MPSAIKKENQNIENVSENLFQKMKDLNEKLLSLDYAQEFVPKYKCPPINRYFFCRPFNQAQQFFTFCCLSSYLINKLNRQDDSIKVDSFDDPNLTIEKILKASQNFLDIQQYSTAEKRQKLKQGYGIEVISLLTNLTDKLWIQEPPQQASQTPSIEIVIKNSEGQIIDPDDLDDDDDNAEVDDDDENYDNEIELEEEFEDYLDVESDLIAQDDWENGSIDIQQQQQQQQQSSDSNTIDQRKMIVANTDLTEWKLELERVLPQINSRFITNQNQNPNSSSTTTAKFFENEWRIHLKAANRNHSTIEKIFTETNGMLNQIVQEIKIGLDKIQSKENYLQQNSNTLLAEWINVRERALILKNELNQSLEELEEKSQRLQELNDEDRRLKQSIEEFSLRINDSSPLAEAKKAKEMLKQELIRINLQIGVAIQTLVRHVSQPSSNVY